MIVRCEVGCRFYFDDEFRSTLCPHDTFPANDGHNQFAHHPESYLSSAPKAGAVMDQEWLNEHHPAARQLLGTEAARTAYVTGRLFGGQKIEVNHFARLVEVVDACERTGVDPWPHVREGALGLCRENAHYLDEAVARLHAGAARA